MNRLLGLLLILGLIFPFFLGLGGLLVAGDVISQVQATVTRRVDAISARLSQTEETINAVSARYDALKVVADQVSAAARAAALTVSASMTDTTARYTGVDLADGTSVPAANLTVPSLSAARGFLQNLYDTVASLSTAISETTAINQIPGVFGQAVTEAQGLSADLDALSATYSPTLLVLGILCGVWLAILYVALVFRWLKRGWQMLLGRAVQTRPI